MTGVPIIGFSIGTRPVAAPVLTAAGRLEPLAPPAGPGPHWHGWVLAGWSPGEDHPPPGGGGPADGLAEGPAGTAVLLAGELYDRARLRAAVGESAAGAVTDAELLLACWLRYGPAGLRLVNGRFAVVIAEPVPRDGSRGLRLVAATDHAGSVPLYVRCDSSGVRLATEAKALATSAAPLGGEPLGGDLPGTDRAWPGSAVRRLRAGTLLSLTPGQPASALHTWRPPLHRLAVDADDATRSVARVLDEAVRARLGAGPVTVVLSGGIDSSAVTALACAAGGPVDTVSLGTDAGDEFDAARLVAEHVGTRHTELRANGHDLVRQLPFAVAAAEITDADVLEYLLPLVVLYQLLPAGLRVVTGYGADIPLGGMHRGTDRLDALDAVIAHDMATFDGLNELSPVLGAHAGHWTTHPYWDRAVLDLLVSLEPGLKYRQGRDKWVLREAVRELLPAATVQRPKLGIHEGSGATSTWTAMLVAAGVRPPVVPAVKAAMAREMHRQVVVLAQPPDQVSFDDVLRAVVSGPALPAVEVGVR